MSNCNERFVHYHSPEWKVLVETGWTTATVADGVARMISRRTAWDIDDERVRLAKMKNHHGPIYMGD